MREAIRIDNVRFTSANPCEVRSGLLGWISFALNKHIRADGIALRRMQDGWITLSFPCRRDREGNKRFFIRPLSDEARREIERQVFQALGIKEKSA
jgi:DNA-binding cell septation regulator SpoVG